MKADFDKIDINLTRLKSDIDAPGGELPRDYVIAAIEAKRSDVTIHVLTGPKDPIESRRVLAQGDVVASLTVFFETKFYEPLSVAKSRLLQIYLNELLNQLPQPLELYLIEGSPSDHTEAECKVLTRVREMIGSEERAKAWFNYQPLPAFDNKPPVNWSKKVGLTPFCFIWIHWRMASTRDDSDAVYFVKSHPSRPDSLLEGPASSEASANDLGHCRQTDRPWLHWRGI